MKCLEGQVAKKLWAHLKSLTTAAVMPAQYIPLCIVIYGKKTFEMIYSIHLNLVGPKRISTGTPKEPLKGTTKGPQKGKKTQI